MAANDYYDTSYKDTHHNAPLPHAPTNQSAQSISPVTSPFDDQHRYEYPGTSSQNLTQHSQPMGYDDTSYHGPTSGRYDTPGHRPGDPFTDQNAIPLQNQGKMGGSQTGYNADPEGRMYPQPMYVAPAEKRRRDGWFKGRITWVCYILTLAQISVFIGEIIRNSILTGSPIEIHPQFNIMIGPSPFVMINFGARYPPCMHNIVGVTDNSSMPWACPNNTASTLNYTAEGASVNICSLQEACGSSSVPASPSETNQPNQWWRFIVPIFMHAGLIHIGFNMLLQLTLGRDMEKEIGPLRFALVYFSSGIFGFVLGGNYAAPGIASTGASGSLFGILALVLLDLLYNWNTRRSPVKDLLFLLLDFAIAFVLGLLPGLDNFSHIGGFLMGIVLGICLLHSPARLRERIGVDEPPYSAVTGQPENSGPPALAKFAKQPVGFFKGRKPLWWAWWFVRVGALVAVFIGFILLLKNFYVWKNQCSWCKHLTCLPVKGWCDIGQFNVAGSNGTSKVKMARDLLELSLKGAM
ncbi:rhomboid-domain-containing protein [Lophiostoma macrostomum CBS 122681]|uniref:Rhomboid-type serine protease n=1 Tax=Lophiostoma macrostomum CBS 122681 TaxID=1314788 RepID=A0A6A6T3P7_9PLEO|nr:rhomboid-domain-containing protein [Lophiostoma macrostomum CBS 122681]